MAIWIESRIEPRWFGLWHRRVYFVCTEFMRQRFERREEAEEWMAYLRQQLG